MWHMSKQNRWSNCWNKQYQQSTSLNLTFSNYVLCLQIKIVKLDDLIFQEGIKQSNNSKKDGNGFGAEQSMQHIVFFLVTMQNIVY